MMGILSESHRESELNLLQQLKISQSAFGIKMSAAILALLPTCSHCFICVNNLSITSMVSKITYMNKSSKLPFIHKLLLASKVIEA